MKNSAFLLLLSSECENQKRVPSNDSVHSIVDPTVLLHFYLLCCVSRIIERSFTFWGFSNTVLVLMFPNDPLDLKY